MNWILVVQRLRLRQALLATALPTLVGCATSLSQPEPVTWDPVEEADAVVVFDAAQFGLSNPEYRQAELRGRWVAERSRWPVNESGAWAEFDYVRLTSTNERFFTDGGTDTIDKELSVFWQGPLELGSSGESRNAIGDLEFQEFVAFGERNCVYFRQFFNSIATSRYDTGDAGRALGKSRISGLHCQREPPALQRFFDSFSLRAALPWRDDGMLNAP